MGDVYKWVGIGYFLIFMIRKKNGFLDLNEFSKCKYLNKIMWVFNNL